MAAGMEPLLKRLETIKNAYLPDGILLEKPAEGKDGKPVDPFEQAKSDVMGEVRQIRDMIKQRDDSEAENPGGTMAVRLARDVRQAIASVQGKQADLKKANAAWEKKFDRQLRKAQKRAESSKATENDKKAYDVLKEQKATRTEILELLDMHIDECQKLSKKRFLGNDALNASSSSGMRDATVTEIPDVDDPKFQLLKKNDEEIDALLDELSNELVTTKQVALDMSEAVEAQGELLDNLEEKVDKAQAKVDRLNEQAEKILEKVGKGDKICMDIILIVILLGIIGVIVKII